LGRALDNWTRATELFAGGLHNNTSTTQSYASGVVQPADMLNLHPGFSGERSVLRWTAPAAGSYLIEGKFQGWTHAGHQRCDHHAQRPSVLSAKHQQLWSAKALFSLTRTLAAGDMIEFTVGLGQQF